jgi:hypothetical protein
MNGFTQAQNVITKEVITDLKSIVVPKRSTTILELSRGK